MNAKEAVSLAKQHLLELFASESISNLGLEEVEFDPARQHWDITLGFSRPWDIDAPSIVFMQKNPARTYKRVIISDPDKRVMSVKNRNVADA